LPQGTPVSCPPLYYPESVEELLTEPILGKLMLGFTVALKVPVALQDRKRRYDLFGDPYSHFCNFCRILRRDYKKDAECKDWDKYIADVLLDGRPQHRTPKPIDFSRPFPCHASMTDVAEVISLAGHPFAVLHGGQLPPMDPAWQQTMRGRLSELLSAQDPRIETLLGVARDMSGKEINVSEKDKQFRTFAREVEDVLNRAYSQRRTASEEALLKWIIDALTAAQVTEWPALWDELGRALAAVTQACNLDRMGFLMGSQAGNRFELEAKSVSTRGAWSQEHLLVGAYWEQIKHKPVVLADQSWTRAFRQSLGIRQDEVCLLAPTQCRGGTPPANFPSLLLAIGDAASAHGTSNLIGKVANEIGRRITAMSNHLELLTALSAKAFAAII
jgi:hypothetical protein